MKFSTSVVCLAVLVLAVAVVFTEQCLPNNDACQPDGSAGTCCSGSCYKQPGWNIGICSNRQKRGPACLGGGMPCHSDGSTGNCCSGLCNQQAGAEWGNCS